MICSVSLDAFLYNGLRPFWSQPCDAVLARVMADSLIRNQQVGGSIPLAGTNENKGLAGH